MRKQWRRGTRHEVSTASRDPSLQLVKGDPYGTLTFMGIPVPAAPPTTPTNRYLFLLAAAQFETGQVARLVGMRQYLTIGETVPSGGSGGAYPLERPVVTPNWHFSDANVSWHLRRYELRPNSNASEFNQSGMSYLLSGTPALLFVNAPAEGGGYSAPLPPGNVVMPDLGNFHDIRFPWANDHAWDSLDIEIKGPCTIGLFASIQQTNPSTRAVLNLPGSLPGGVQSLDPEDQFILNFTNAVYTRVAGSLIFEQDAMLEDYSDTQPWDDFDPLCVPRINYGGGPKRSPDGPGHNSVPPTGGTSTDAPSAGKTRG